MTDQDIEGLVREAWEYWARCEPLPDDLRALLSTVPAADVRRVWDAMYQKGDRA